ncbi:MAG: FAD/NAD(P)-binding protein [Pirellulales bacterium]|nr:FAD/NAD(P)-binding protein [Pirellulales bacterium]
MTTVLEHPTSASPWLSHAAHIVAIRNEVPGVATYDLVFDDPQRAASYRFAPGQFNMLYMPGYGEAAISISSDPTERGFLSHTIRVAGNVTQAIARQQVGGHVALRGPFGSSWPVNESRGRDIVFACGGIGLAPLRPAIYEVMNHRADFGRVIVLYGARTPSGLLYTNEFDTWRAKDIEIEVTVDIGDPEWHGHVGVVPLLFYQHRLQAHRTTVMTCGPEIMMRFIVFEALARKIQPEDIFVSMERNMSCAMGFCGHCQIGPHFVCKDGPVFNYRQAEPFFNVEDM